MIWSNETLASVSDASVMDEGKSAETTALLPSGTEGALVRQMNMTPVTCLRGLKLQGAVQ